MSHGVLNLYAFFVIKYEVKSAMEGNVGEQGGTTHLPCMVQNRITLF